MKTNFKLDTVEILITDLLKSIELHKLYENDLQQTEPYAFLFGYNRQKIESIKKSLEHIKEYINK